MSDLSIEAIVGRDNARQSAVVAAHLGLDLPPRLAELAAQRAELQRLAGLPMLDLPLPDKDPRKIEKQLREHASEMVQYAALVPTAATLAERVDGLAAAAVRDAVPGWCAELVVRFDAELATFVDAIAGAPFDAIAGHEPPQAVEAFMTAARTATLLDSLVLYRSQFGATANEARARPDTLWLVVDVVVTMPEDRVAFMATWRPLQDHIAALTNNVHRPVLTALGREQGLPEPSLSAASRWRALVNDPALVVGLARFEEAEVRYERHQSRAAAAHALGNSYANVKATFPEHLARANSRAITTGAR